MFQTKTSCHSCVLKMLSVRLFVFRDLQFTEAPEIHVVRGSRLFFLHQTPWNRAASGIFIVRESFLEIHYFLVSVPSQFIRCHIYSDFCSTFVGGVKILCGILSSSFDYSFIANLPIPSENRIPIVFESE